MAHAIEQIDPWSGTALAKDAQRNAIVVQPGGAIEPVPSDPNRWGLYLVPGGRELLGFHRMPAIASVFRPGTAAPKTRVHTLPAEVTPYGGRDRPIWEDAHHILFVLDSPSRDGKTGVIRLDTRTGALERVPLPLEDIYRPLLIRPLLHRPPG
jgi:hypothetical protein